MSEMMTLKEWVKLPRPNLEEVEVKGSSQIKTLLYDALKKELFIEFSNDTIYMYDPIDQQKFDKFKASPSKGKYFHEKIKSNKKIKWEQIRKL